MRTHIQGSGDATICGRSGPKLKVVTAEEAAKADCVLCLKFSSGSAASKPATKAAPKAKSTPKAKVASKAKATPTVAAKPKAKAAAKPKAKAAPKKKAKGIKRTAALALTEARIREIIREEIAAQGSPFDLLSTKDAAELLGVGRRKVEKWVKAGKLAAVDLSQKQVRIARDAVDSLLEKRKK